MNTSLLIISISSFFSIIMSISFFFVAELIHSKKRIIYKRIFSKKFIFYNKKKYSMFYLSNKSLYINFFSWNFYILLIILFFFLEKSKAEKDYGFIISEYEKKVYFSLFTTSIILTNLICVIFIVKNFIIQKKVKNIIKPFDLSEVKNLFNSLKDNNFFDFFYTEPCNERIFINKFLLKMDKMKESYSNKNKEYRYLFYFIFFIIFSVNLMAKHKWINNENIDSPQRKDFKESIELFNDFFDKKFDIDKLI